MAGAAEYSTRALARLLAWAEPLLALTKRAPGALAPDAGCRAIVRPPPGFASFFSSGGGATSVEVAKCEF